MVEYAHLHDVTVEGELGVGRAAGGVERRGDALLDAVIGLLSELPALQPLAEEAFVVEERLTGWEARQEEEGVYSVSGASMDSLISAVNFSDYESLNWFHKTLRASGVIARLRELGLG